MVLRSTLFVMLAIAVANGCATRAAPEAEAIRAGYRTDPTERLFVPSVQAACAPPDGWSMEPLKQSKNHTHQVWLSPTGSTAYGVIRFSLPLPVGPETVLYFFLREMRNSEGEARLISKRRDPALKGLRFVAEGGKYTVRTNLTTKGFRGWAIYAGTRRDREILPSELAMAELARENTETGVDANSAAAKP
ncbi:MAG TPA: hypothetical protein VGR35_18675 [Tepidisphaeraceae bacterium]|nr:hypothetical protein [Tepidisphaeraceae bacterium]